MRLRNIPNAKEKLLESEYLIKNFPIEINENTVLEMGMGKGEMLVELANKNPHIMYIGIEKYPTVALKSMKKAEKLKLKNFKIINQDIIKLPDLINGKTNLIWLTFSDPWPKKRHAKRRLTHKIFLDIYKSLLSENGILKFKTDNDFLFQYSIESLNEYGAKIINSTNDFHNSNLSEGNVMTGYEKKWSENGKKINYLEVKF
ncbi:tRNA (guanosine(46)-N7)-methyltransferase TrmB [Mesomycoplasma lagogenitalium]|uniref:tRNA (guanine-N(7)-)-methyltransferase n=1 Tax=Mesomycoplasma lagogenitalium TaxID=171286 RepID=A0ABY8LW15_9BACT|nr:tRNA (guanosine(46)-N7)-methyltransferase TrmB [Mesomycoplasma lagogenitalium]WGI36616.1 tRNA (guanosine(46)-N7)-methyltransferase TrmB [Mesomycoplasma lagogenitalium]